MGKTGKCIDKNPLQRDGTSQALRLPKALDPSTLNLHEFTLQDWMSYAYEFASHVKYFDITNDLKPNGNWQNFFIPHEDINPFVNADHSQTVEPHLALFITFLKLMAHSQEHLNGLTKKHLEFYYRRILRLQNKTFTPDKAFVIFELAKNVLTENIPSGTLLLGGKDKNGKPLHYSTDGNTTVNAIEVVHIKSIYHKHGDSIRYANVANSQDGLGTALDAESIGWYAFGHDERNRYPELPVASVGFALASNILLLKGGIRTITIKLTLRFQSSFDPLLFTDLNEKINVLLSAEKGWYKPEIISAAINENEIDATLSDCTIVLKADETSPAIIEYDAELHMENFITNSPVARILFETSDTAAYTTYSALTSAIVNSCTIDVNVQKFKNFVAANDIGTVDTSKPFYPFGTIPKIGSNFLIGSSEVFSKKWGNIKLNISWKDKPNLNNRYTGYGVTGINDNYFTVAVTNSFGKPISNNSKQLFNTGAESSNELKLEYDTSESGTFSLPDPILQNNSPYNRFIIQKYLAGHTYLFSLKKFNPGFVESITDEKAFELITNGGFLKLSLLKDFLHTKYPKALAEAAAIIANGGSATIPEEPYSPQIDTIDLDYTASASNIYTLAASDNTPANKLSNYAKRNVQLFHETPFGQSEQHIFLKDQFSTKITDKSIRLVPSFESEGACYIALSKAQASQRVSILFYVSEGSENPLSPSFSDTVKIQWHYLSNNEWLAVDNTNILQDGTNNFLRSGIITFILPTDVSTENTLLPEGCVWLRASLPENLKYDSVSKFILIKAQAAQVVFADNGNEYSHLSAPLAEQSISKFLDKPAGIKKVEQPYASFDGANIETDTVFYTRISERLRHKNRAINIWDYERLILEKFPTIYKVKCLNHTSLPTANDVSNSEVEPGYVSLIPIPFVRNKNLFDILQPRVSSNTLREIESYISSLNSNHITFIAEHPYYDEVLFDFKVRFHKEYDPNTYTQLLNEELVRFLAPWASNSDVQILFGGSIFKSVVIAFIEEKNYVEYITDFKMKLADGNWESQLSASTSRSILTSVKTHNIEPLLTEPAC
ncbi:MAG: baseplate J/gp47 family protein [Flavobacteriales bacterium]|nr:baseplate J/gp47 family protein [Flavobacteriales bacterium]